MNRRFASVVGIGLVVALGACASQHDLPPPRIVEVPVAVPCRLTLGVEPEWPDSDQALRAAPDLFSRVKLLAAGRLLDGANSGIERGVEGLFRLGSLKSSALETQTTTASRRGRRPRTRSTVRQVAAAQLRA